MTVAVSGGADSTALLHLAVAAGLRVTAVHVDHGLRPGSEREAGTVAALARRWGAEFRSERAPVAPGGDLEARARAARRAVLPPDTLYGHTADDQAETVLLRLLRGTGPAGLAAMRPDTHPLLRLRRRETRTLCAELGVVPLDDPTNRDPRFTRNRVRHEVLPLLDDVAGRDVVPLLCRLAGLAATQAEVLDDLAAAVDPDDVTELAGLPAAVAAVALRRRWAALTDGAPPPDAAALGRVLEVAHGGAVGCEVTAGWSVRRSAGRLRWRGPSTEAGDRR
ncbi:MAG: tRNA lysidine(34) synthetase TilS [Microthrixaceae bacterium]